MNQELKFDAGQRASGAGVELCEEGNVKIKTAELTGAALRWAVAKAEGRLENREVIVVGKQLYGFGYDGDRVLYEPDYDWSLGGPIVEREGINLRFFESDKPPYWAAEKRYPSSRITYQKHGGIGPTPLVAAMRAFVASRLGDEVEIPSELLK